MSRRASGQDQDLCLGANSLVQVIRHVYCDHYSVLVQVKEKLSCPCA